MASAGHGSIATDGMTEPSAGATRRRDPRRRLPHRSRTDASGSASGRGHGSLAANARRIVGSRSARNGFARDPAPAGARARDHPCCPPAPVLASRGGRSAAWPGSDPGQLCRPAIVAAEREHEPSRGAPARDRAGGVGAIRDPRTGAFVSWPWTVNAEGSGRFFRHQGGGDRGRCGRFLGGASR